MAMGGPGQLTEDELRQVEEGGQNQNQFFDRFEREVQQNPPIEAVDLQSDTSLVLPEPMTSREFAARAELYGNSVWVIGINIIRRAALNVEIFIAERRVHLLGFGEHDPCKTCIKESELGWQIPGTLNEIGDSECMGNCDCYFEWKDDDQRIYVSPWGRHNPKGYNQPGAPKTRPPRIAYTGLEGTELDQYEIADQPPASPKETPIKDLPGSPGPPEKPKPPPKGKPPKPEPEPPLNPEQTLAEWMEEAKLHGHTFDVDVKYERLEED